MSDWGSGDPWGQKKSDKKSKGGNSDNITDFFNRGNSSDWSNMPTKIPGYAGLILFLFLLFSVWVYNSIYVVKSGHQGVELLFGRPKSEINMPGLHFKWFPFESVEIVPTAAVQQINIPDVSSSGSATQGLMLSTDQNIVDIRFAVLWKVKDPKEFLFNVRDQRRAIIVVAESAMREYVGKIPADVIRTTGRTKTEGDVKNLIQKALDIYKSGVEVIRVNLEKADPPQEVSDAFEEVQRAKQEQVSMIEKARAYSNRKLGAAKGDASKIRQEAQGYAATIVAEAVGQTTRYKAIYNEYVKAPEVTRTKLYYESITDVLKNAEKVIIDPKVGNGVLPYLPLNRITNQGNSKKKESSK